MPRSGGHSHIARRSPPSAKPIEGSSSDRRDPTAASTRLQRSRLCETGFGLPTFGSTAADPTGQSTSILCRGQRSPRDIAGGLDLDKPEGPFVSLILRDRDWWEMAFLEVWRHREKGDVGAGRHWRIWKNREQFHDHE